MAKRAKSTFERLRADRLNHKQKRQLSRKVASGDPSLSIVNPNAGGIDVGSESHFAAVPSDRDPNPVQEFGCWTADLIRMRSGSSPAGSTRLRCRLRASTGLRWTRY